jgi:hypothetical protein
MAPFIRFKVVEISSKVSFKGKCRKVLKYPVRSISIQPENEGRFEIREFLSIPEIFY